MYRRPGLTPGRGQNIYNCDYSRKPGPGQVCDVDIRSWDPCTVENDFNYHKASPCIFLKLNKVGRLESSESFFSPVSCLHFLLFAVDSNFYTCNMWPNERFRRLTANCGFRNREKNFMNIQEITKWASSISFYENIYRYTDGYPSTTTQRRAFPIKCQKNSKDTLGKSQELDLTRYVRRPQTRTNSRQH